MTTPKTLFALLLACCLGALTSRAQTTTDVTVESYGINGAGRPTSAAQYYFLQAEGSAGKVKPSAATTTRIDVERQGSIVYFKQSGTDNYLKLTGPDGQVTWTAGKDDKARWQETDPLQPGAGPGWKSYVAVPETARYLRHWKYGMYADPRTGPRSDGGKVFDGDATWSIQGGQLVPPAGTPNAAAYGRKQLQTYAINNNSTNSFVVGSSNGQEKVVDLNNAATGTPQLLEVRYKAGTQSAVLIEVASQKYLTTDGSGNVSLSATEQPGSYWEVTPALMAGQGADWFSLKSRLLPNNYLRHSSFVLYAQPATANAAYFKGDASWKLVAK